MIPNISRVLNTSVNKISGLRNRSYQDKNDEPKCPQIKTDIPGPKSRKLLEKLKIYQNVGNAEIFGNYEKSVGNYLLDADGNIFLNLNMQGSGIPLGYNFKELSSIFSNPKYVHCITDTISLSGFPAACCPSRIEHIVQEVSPNLPNICFSSCDSTAVEEGLKAMMLAYLKYQKEQPLYAEDIRNRLLNQGSGSPRLSILSFKNSQHGSTIGALNVSNADPSKKLDITTFDWPVADYPQYKYPLEENIAYNAKQDRNSLATVEELIQKWEDKDLPVAGMIIEPLQTSTNHVVSEKFLLKLEELSFKHGIYLMFDEAKTCCGATGKFWAHEHYHLKCPPDILTFGGKTQISGFLHREDLSPKLKTESVNLAKILIFETIINYIEKHNLMRNVQKTGEVLKTRLIELEKRYYDLIHSTRGLGTLLAFDAQSPQLRNDLLRRLQKKGILCGRCGHQGIAIRPALTFNENHSEIFTERLENVIKETIFLNRKIQSKSEEEIDSKYKNIIIEHPVHESKVEPLLSLKDTGIKSKPEAEQIKTRGVSLETSKLQDKNLASNATTKVAEKIKTAMFTQSELKGDVSDSKINLTFSQPNELQHSNLDSKSKPKVSNYDQNKLKDGALGSNIKPELAEQIERKDSKIKLAYSEHNELQHSNLGSKSKSVVSNYDQTKLKDGVLGSKTKPELAEQIEQKDSKIKLAFSQHDEVQHSNLGSKSKPVVSNYDQTKLKDGALVSKTKPELADQIEQKDSKIKLAFSQHNEVQHSNLGSKSKPVVSNYDQTKLKDGALGSKTKPEFAEQIERKDSKIKLPFSQHNEQQHSNLGPKSKSIVLNYDQNKVKDAALGSKTKPELAEQIERKDLKLSLNVNAKVAKVAQNKLKGGVIASKLKPEFPKPNELQDLGLSAHSEVSRFAQNELKEKDLDSEMNRSYKVWTVFINKIKELAFQQNKPEVIDVMQKLEVIKEILFSKIKLKELLNQNRDKVGPIKSNTKSLEPGAIDSFQEKETSIKSSSTDPKNQVIRQEESHLLNNTKDSVSKPKENISLKTSGSCSKDLVCTITFPKLADSSTSKSDCKLCPPKKTPECPAKPDCSSGSTKMEWPKEPICVLNKSDLKPWPKGSKCPKQEEPKKCQEIPKKAPLCPKPVCPKTSDELAAARLQSLACAMEWPKEKPCSPELLKESLKPWPSSNTTCSQEPSCSKSSSKDSTCSQSQQSGCSQKSSCSKLPDCPTKPCKPAPLECRVIKLCPKRECGPKTNKKLCPRPWVKCPEPKSCPQPKCQPKSQPNCQTKSEPKCQPKCEPKCPPKCEPKCPPKCEPKCPPKSEFKCLKYEPRCRPKPEFKCEPRSQPKCQPKSQPKCQPKPEPKCQPKCEFKCPPKPESTCPPKQPKCPPKPEPKCPPKPEPKCPPKPEPKCPPKQPKCPPKPEPKCPPKSEPKCPPKSEPKCPQ